MEKIEIQKVKTEHNKVFRGRNDEFMMYCAYPGCRSLVKCFTWCKACGALPRYVVKNQYGDEGILTPGVCLLNANARETEGRVKVTAEMQDQYVAAFSAEPGRVQWRERNQPSQAKPSAESTPFGTDEAAGGARAGVSEETTPPGTVDFDTEYFQAAHTSDPAEQQREPGSAVKE